MNQLNLGLLIKKGDGTMLDMSVGKSFDELERDNAPTPINGTVEVLIDKVEDAPVRKNNRPQWKFTLKVVNRPDLPNRNVFMYAQLPWQDPAQGGAWDYSNTFTIVNIKNATKISIPDGAVPDPKGETLYGIPKQSFVGLGMVVNVMSVPREDDPDLMGDKVKIILPKKGGTIA